MVEDWEFEAPRTKDAKAALEALGIDGKALVVIGRDDENAFKSFRNLPRAHPILAAELNAYDILCSDWVVFTRATLPGAVQAAAAPSTASAPTEPEAPAAGSEAAPAEEQA